MGTLFDQRPRGEHWLASLDSYADGVAQHAKQVMADHGVTLEQALAIIAEAREQRHGDLWRNDRDIHDEQLGGLGKILLDICSALERFNGDIDPIRRLSAGL